MEENKQQDPKAQAIDIIHNTLNPAAVFEQFAEELIELAHVAQKQARLIRGENPTSADMVDLAKDIEEELADVFVCLDVLGLVPSENLMNAKMARWTGRIVEAAKKQQKPPEHPQEDVEVTPAEVIE